MPKTLRQKKTALAVIAAIIILFIGWFSWMSMVTAKTDFMKSKIQTGLSISIQTVENDAPRIQILDEGGYFVPDIKGNLPSDIPTNSSWRQAYGALLVSLNQDTNVPLTKVTALWLNSDYSSTIDAHATVQLEVFPGITRQVTVTQSMPLPHFKNPTGNAVIH